MDIIPAYEEEVWRFEFFGKTLERITVRHPVTMEVLRRMETAMIYPAAHFLVSRPRLEEAIKSIEEELWERVRELEAQGKLLEAQRLKQRTLLDLEMLRTVGYCPGIENYSRHLSGRRPGERPKCLLDYFPPDFLPVIDESHVTIPQLRGMYEGDRSRKLVLVEHGFRLPSALDNRPLKFEEFEELVGQVIYMSATPGPYELEKAGGKVVEQIIRPTGLVDPEMEVRPTEGMVDDMLEEIRKRAERGERVLVNTLTKRSAEELAAYFKAVGLRADYLHSELDAFERVKVLRRLRLGEIDVLVGVNLLREGLDLPEVSLVIITDAERTGFLRSYTSLIQIAGRAARNAAGKVILYADEITDAMRKAIAETERRRRIQLEYNRRHGITPKTIKKSVQDVLKTTEVADEAEVGEDHLEEVRREIEGIIRTFPRIEAAEILARKMKERAELLDFEAAALYRDALRALKGERAKKGKREENP